MDNIHLVDPCETSRNVHCQEVSVLDNPNFLQGVGGAPSTSWSIHISFLLSGASTAFASSWVLFCKQSVNYLLVAILDISQLSCLSPRLPLAIASVSKTWNVRIFFLHLDSFPLFSISRMTKGFSILHRSLYHSGGLDWMGVQLFVHYWIPP